MRNGGCGFRILEYAKRRLWVKDLGNLQNGGCVFRILDSMAFIWDFLRNKGGYTKGQVDIHPNMRKEGQAHLNM